MRPLNLRDSGCDAYVDGKKPCRHLVLVRANLRSFHQIVSTNWSLCIAILAILQSMDMRYWVKKFYKDASDWNDSISQLSQGNGIMGEWGNGGMGPLAKKPDPLSWKTLQPTAIELCKDMLGFAESKFSHGSHLFWESIENLFYNSKFVAGTQGSLGESLRPHPATTAAGGTGCRCCSGARGAFGWLAHPQNQDGCYSLLKTADWLMLLVYVIRLFFSFF